MFADRKRILNFRGTSEDVQRAILLGGVEDQHMILAIRQPKPMLGGALVIGYRLDEHTPNQLRAELQKHFVYKHQIKLIVRYYEAELRIRQGLTPAETDDIPARVFILNATRLSPDLPGETDDA